MSSVSVGFRVVQSLVVDIEISSLNLRDELVVQLSSISVAFRTVQSWVVDNEVTSRDFKDV